MVDNNFFHETMFITQKQGNIMKPTIMKKKSVPKHVETYIDDGYNYYIDISKRMLLNHVAGPRIENNPTKLVDYAFPLQTFEYSPSWMMGRNSNDTIHPEIKSTISDYAIRVVHNILVERLNYDGSNRPSHSNLNIVNKNAINSTINEIIDDLWRMVNNTPSPKIKKVIGNIDKRDSNIPDYVINYIVEHIDYIVKSKNTSDIDEVIEKWIDEKIKDIPNIFSDESLVSFNENSKKVKCESVYNYIGISVFPFLFTNIAEILNDYKDDIVVTPTSKPVAFFSYKDGVSSSDDIVVGELGNDSNKGISYKKLRIYAKRLIVCEEIVDRLCIDFCTSTCGDLVSPSESRYYYKLKSVTINQVSLAAKKATETYKNKNYHVRLSTRNEPYKNDSVGNITMFAGHGSFDINSIPNPNNTIIEDIESFIMEMVSGVPDDIPTYFNIQRCGLYFSPYQWGNKQRWSAESGSIKFDCCVRNSEYYTSIFSPKNTVTSNHIEQAVKFILPRYSNEVNNIGYFNLQIYVPIFLNQDIKLYSKILNKGKLLGRTVPEITLMPYCMTTQIDNIIELMDKVQ